MARTLDAIIKRLEDRGVGVAGEDIFAGGDVALPESGDFLTIMETGGPGLSRTHNAGDLRHPSFQITARGDEYPVVAAKCDAAWEALGGGVQANRIANLTVEGITFLYIRPASEPFGMPSDANSRVRIMFNVETMRQ
jgi:hypothetical protein